MKVISFSLACLLAFSARAQFEHKPGMMPLMLRTLGGSFQQFDGLNSRVSGLPQYEQLKDYSGTIGLGWLKEHNRVITDGTITAGSTMSGNHKEKSSTVRYLGINADIGYDLLKSDKTLLYPLAGLGLQGYQAIFYKDNSAVAFNDVLQSSATQNNIRPVRFTNSFFVYRLGLGFSVKSAKYPGHSIGLQAGYTGSFKKNDWKSNENQTLGNAPTDRISQVYISLMLTNAMRFMKG